MLIWIYIVYVFNYVPVHVEQGTNVAQNIMGGLQIIAMFHL